MSENEQIPVSEESSNESEILKSEFPMPSNEEFQPLPDAVGAELQKKKIPLFLLIPLIIAGILLLFFVYSKWFNFYQRSVWGLNFDYRCGEKAAELQQIELPIAKTLAESIPANSSATIQATEYYFSSKGEISTDISKYTYTHSLASESVRIKTGTYGTFITSSTNLRRNADGNIEQKHGFKWESTEETIQNLYAFFFGVESTDDYKLEYYETSTTQLETEPYDCEIWLMTRTTYNITTYYTIYRYYQNNQLKAVRILDNYNELMQIFDIKSYEFT